MMGLFAFFKRYGLAIGFLVLFAGLVFAARANAQDACSERKLRDLGVAVIDCKGEALCSTTNSAATRGSGGLPSGSSIYMLGDSITKGAETSLGSAFASLGYTSQFNAVVSRSIDSEGEGDETGLEALDNDAAVVSAASAIVVALGTNGDNADGINSALDKIRGLNPTAKIFWVNVFSGGAKDSFNQDLNEVHNSRQSDPAKSFTIVDTVNANIALGEDNIHPNTNGQKTFADTVAAALSGRTSTPTSAGGCACALPGGLSRDERYRTAWAFFIGKNLSAEATAGIMGNLEAESGIDPHNTQNNASAPDGPEIPIDAIRGSHGYGIAQWTSSGRQDNLIAFARETNRSTGDMGLQLDFLWKELTESYAGVLSVLQTPSVTIDSASFTVLSEFEIPEPFTDRGTQAQRDATTAERLALSQAIFNEFSGQSVSGSSGSGSCNSSGASYDLVSADTSNIPCGAGTDAGVADGYRDGKRIVIRLCTVEGTKVNSQVSGAVSRMFNDARAAGIPLEMNGSFRDMDGQVGIYNKWCADGGFTPTPPPYPKASYQDYQRCPGGAPPGFSNHQAGMAIDFNCNGALIPQSYSDASANSCFQWLVANAARYGFYEFSKGQDRNETGYEGWHWSVDGT